MDDDLPESGFDVAEMLRVAVIFGLLAVDAWILWDAVKERPEMLVLRARVREMVEAPIRRYREIRRAEKHVVWEAIDVVSSEAKEERP